MKPATYTIDNFSDKIQGTEVTAIGRDYNINYSDILTKLIQECGRLCEKYASDLFITWNSIDKALKEKAFTPLTTSSYLFGIRENGVDHNDFILARYRSNGSYARYDYRKMFRLDITIGNNNEIEMQLYEIFKPF